MTDRQRANALLNYGIALGADGMTYQQAMDYTMRDIAAIREDERKADHSPDAENMGVLEVVENIRLGGFALNTNNPDDHGPNGDDYHFTLTDTEAAAQIEQYGRRVPRAMLDDIWLNGYKCQQGKKNTDMADIAAKYGVKIEEEMK